MNKYYYTFGTAQHFPYGINDFVEVNAKDMTAADNVFRENYPDYNKDILNCAFVYTEDEFKEIKEKYYPGSYPVDILISDKSFDRTEEYERD